MVTAGDDTRSGPDPLGAARDAGKAAGERFDAAREAAADVAQKIPKPRLRGVSHQWAFFVSLVTGAALILAASGGEEVLAVSIYAFSLSALLGTSALYHRVTWQPAARRWMRRLDHTAIFVLIAGTYTPFALLVMHGSLAEVILIVVWVSALGGAILNLAWWNAPKWFTAAVYLSTGWAALAAMPQIWNELGAGAVGLLALGGLLYSAGAVIYARRRPDPNPEVFGYHEIFHLLVIVAATLNYAVIAFFVLPHG